MILTKLYEFALFIFDLITSFLNLPPLSAEVSEMIDTVFNYMIAGVELLSCYTHFNYLLILMSLVISVDVGLAIYYLVMWVLKKVPMASIE